MKKYIRAILILYGCILGFCGCRTGEEVLLFTSEAAEAAYAGKPEQEDCASGDRTMIKVYVCGAVAEPGVVALKEDARIIDAVLLAGGMTEDADETDVNLAARLQDGEMIYVPTKEETSRRKEAQDKEDLVDINTADKARLCTLPGIGESKAEDILTYREKNGAFQSIEDIMKVPGIKESLFEKIKGKITAD